MHDNVTAHTSIEYDNKILATIPLYDMFYTATLDLVQNAQITVNKWLDTGCGTGNLLISARELFPKTEFVLADPSNEMLSIAKSKTNIDDIVSFNNNCTQNLKYDDNNFDIITAIQCHHYLDKKLRIKAVENCYRMLRTEGIFVCFENIMPLSVKGKEIGLKRWENYQVQCGKSIKEAKCHIERFEKDYFPITIIEQIELLKKVGFKNVEILWVSYMQAGLYGIK